MDDSPATNTNRSIRNTDHSATRYYLWNCHTSHQIQSGDAMPFPLESIYTRSADIRHTSRVATATVIPHAITTLTFVTLHTPSLHSLSLLYTRHHRFIQTMNTLLSTDNCDYDSRGCRLTIEGGERTVSVSCVVLVSAGPL